MKGKKNKLNNNYEPKYNDWTELTKATKATIGAGGNWYICPVLDYKRANKKLKRTFGEAIAAATIYKTSSNQPYELTILP